MNGATICWGPVADALGHCRWVGHELSADGTVATRSEQWATEPASDYARSHPAPMEARWCHGSVLGRVIALRRMHGKLFAIAELDEVTAPDLEELAARNGPLRWSASTRKVGSGPLVLRECSLTPTPASIGLAAVSWHQPGVSKGDPPMWVRADVAEGRRDVNRRSRWLDVLEVDEVDDGLPPLSAYSLAGVRGAGGDMWAAQYQAAQARGHSGVVWDGPNGVTYGIR